MHRPVRWVLDAVQGYQIEWSEQPHQWYAPMPDQFSNEQPMMESLDLEIQRMWEKGAISPVVNHQDGFLSTIFLVPKKGGDHRPIINRFAIMTTHILMRSYMYMYAATTDWVGGGGRYSKYHCKRVI